MNILVPGQTGLFSGLRSLVMKKVPPEALIEFITHHSVTMTPEILPDGAVYDLVISCPVYTQLVYTQIEVILRLVQKQGHYSDQAINNILTAASVALTPMLERYNDLLLSVLMPGGHILMLADLLEIEVSDPDLTVAKTCIHATGQIEDLIQNKFEEAGLGMAWTGLEMLEQSIKTIRNCHAIWPFDETREFIVRGLFGQSLRQV